MHLSLLVHRRAFAPSALMAIDGAPSARHWERVFNLRRVLNRKRVHKEWQLIAIDVIRELHMNSATSPTSTQFALTSARIASASDNVVAPLSKDEHVAEGGHVHDGGLYFFLAFFELVGAF